MKDLTKTWLGKSQNNLRELDLRFGSRVGFYPKLDLRDLLFRHLKVLKLSYITFTHQWQIDWICSHSPSLQNLSLEESPIIAQATTHMAVDYEGYPDEDQLFNGPPTVLTFHLRWSDVYEQFRTSLSELRVFDQTSNLYNSDQEPMWRTVVGCSQNRYHIYNLSRYLNSGIITARIEEEEWNADSFAYDRLQDTILHKSSERARMSWKTLRELRG
jgi:hypothetical protein